MVLRLCGVQNLNAAQSGTALTSLKQQAHHQDEVCALRNGNDLATAPLALASALDDPRQVEQLRARVTSHSMRKARGKSGPVPGSLRRGSGSRRGCR